MRPGDGAPLNTGCDTNNFKDSTIHFVFTLFFLRLWKVAANEGWTKGHDKDVLPRRLVCAREVQRKDLEELHGRNWLGWRAVLTPRHVWMRQLDCIPQGKCVTANEQVVVRRLRMPGKG